MLKEDSDLIFIEKTHTYIYKGKKVHTSVTSFISSFKKKFDAKTIADNIVMKVKKINRKNEMQRTKYEKDTILKYNCMNSKQIQNSWKPKREQKKQWDNESKIARDEGTRLHKEIETYFKQNKSIPNVISDEFIQFLNYEHHMSKENKWKHVFSELSVYMDNIAGQIDHIRINKDGHYMLEDWKRCKVEKKKKYNNWMKFPFNTTLKDTKMNFYALQLNMYKYLFEHQYHEKVTEMRIVRFRGDTCDPYIVKFIDEGTIKRAIQEFWKKKY